MTSHCIVPKQLLPIQGNTRYILKLRLKKYPQPYTRLNVCMIQEDETAFLTQILYEDMKQEYEIHGPNVDIKNILLSPGEESIDLQDLTIIKQDVTDNTNYYFPYYNLIGGRSKELVAYLSLKTSPLIDMKPIYDAQYVILKEKLMMITIELTLLGSLITASVSTIEKGYAFALGGSLGYIYVKLLEMGIDNVGKKPLLSIADQILRLGSVFILSSSIVLKYQKEIAEDKLFFIIGLLGFMMYRLAFLATYLSDSNEVEIPKEDQSHENDT